MMAAAGGRRTARWGLWLISGSMVFVVLFAALFGVAVVGMLGGGAMGAQPSACGTTGGAPVQVTAGAPGLNPEQLGNAQAIAGVALGLGLGRPGVLLGVLTANVETDLRNLPGGDRDSVGLFQQRQPWGSFEERHNPVIATTMFFQGGKGGQPGVFSISGWEAMDPGVVMQRVQQSQFSAGTSPQYAVKLAMATAATDALMAGQPAVPVAGPTSITIGPLAPATPTPCPGAAPAAAVGGGPGEVTTCKPGQDRAALVAQVLASPNLVLREGREESQSADIRTGLECNTLAVIVSMETLGVPVRLNSLKTDHPVDGGYHPKGMAMDLGYESGDPVGAKVYEFLYRNYLALGVIQIIWAYPPTIAGIDPGAKCIQQDQNGIGATHGVLGDCDALYPSDISGHTDHIHVAIHL